MAKSRNHKKTVGWHPPPELREWIVSKAKRRGVTMTEVLNDLVRSDMERDKEYPGQSATQPQ